MEDVSGKRIVSTRLRANITIREENATAALEAMSRFAVDPKWLIYLPPTMSPPETSRRPDLLEHPDEAFSYFESRGLSRVVCQEKHMGSRAIVIVCRDAQAAKERFGLLEGAPESTGICYTRTGRRFFNDPGLETRFLERIGEAVASAGLWETLDTTWLCPDCELMPWSVKAQELLQHQYAAVGAAAQAAHEATVGALLRARSGGVDVEDLLHAEEERGDMIARYRTAYRHYCWPVASLEDMKLAPFHLLASEGHVHADKDHLWHMTVLERL